MYIDSIKVQNFRVFEEINATFLHPDRDFGALGLPTPRYSNVNLILGNNGAGKTSLLKSIAIACLGPAAPDASLPIYRLIRRVTSGLSSLNPTEALVEASFTAHSQDLVDLDTGEKIESLTAIYKPGGSDEIERPVWRHAQDKEWHPIFNSENQAFFFVGYSANRTVQKPDRFDEGARQMNSFRRAQRVRSLFDESYPLVPLTNWMTAYRFENPGRFTQVKNILNELLAETGYQFTGEVEAGEFVFSRDGLNVPFPALSDGFRAFIGWVSDMLYHVCQTCPPGAKLVDNHGVVMVDEIDLHLHPKWQLIVLPTLSKAFPNIQFIVTSHSPLVVGSLEWMNILLMDFADGKSVAERVNWAIHGLDADQILLTKFFDMESTRAGGRGQMLKSLSLKAREGDTYAARRLLEEMSQGSEAVHGRVSD